MKKIILLLSVFFIYVQLHAQQMIRLNLKSAGATFNEEDLKKLETIKKGEFYRLIIDSINLNLYKVIFKAKDTTIISSVNSFPTFELLNVGGITDILGKINLNSSALATITENAEVKSFFQEKGLLGTPNLLLLERMTSEDFMASYEKFKTEKELLKKILEARMMKEKSNLTSKQKEIKQTKDEISELQLKVQHQLLSYMVLNRTSQSYTDLNVKTTISEVLSQSNILRNKLKFLGDDLNERKEEFANYIAQDKFKIIMADPKNEKLLETSKLLDSAYEKGIADKEKLLAAISAEQTSTWLKELLNKENNKITRYISLPQQFNGDQTKLHIELVPQKEEFNVPSYSTEIKFPIHKKTFIGAGMSFYYANFRQQAYSVSSRAIAPEVNEYSIVEEDQSKGELGVAAMLHFGLRLTHNFALNFVTGPALSLTNTVKPRVALGTGFAYGNKNMLSINYLYMGGYVDVKSNAYTLGNTYNTKPETVTVAKLKGASAISLGYIYKF